MKKIILIKSNKYLVYVRMMMMIIKSIIKSEIIVHAQENIEELLIVFVTKDIKRQKKFL